MALGHLKRFVLLVQIHELDRVAQLHRALHAKEHEEVLLAQNDRLVHVAALIELRQGLGNGDRRAPLPRAVDNLDGLEPVAPRRLPADHDDARPPHLIREVVALLRELADHLQGLVVDLNSILRPVAFMQRHHLLDLLYSTKSKRYVARIPPFQW